MKCKLIQQERVYVLNVPIVIYDMRLNQGRIGINYNVVIIKKKTVDYKFYNDVLELKLENCKYVYDYNSIEFGI